MNINQSGGTSNPSNSPQDSRLSKHPSLDIEKFANQLILAQKSIDWYGQEDSVEEKERIYQEQLKKYRALDDKEDEINATAFLSMINQKTFDEHAVTTRSFIKTETDQEFINEKVDLQKAHLRVPTINQGQDEIDTENFADLINKKMTEKSSEKVKVDTARLGITKESVDSRPEMKPDEQSTIDLTMRQKNQQSANITFNTIKTQSDQTSTKTHATFTSQVSDQSQVKEQRFPGQKTLSPQVAKGTTAIASSQFNTVESRQKVVEDKGPKPVRTSNENVSVKDVQNNIRYMISANRDQLTIKLVPAHLGKLEIQLKKAGERIRGRFKVENKQAKEAIKAKLSTLAKELEEQGIQIDEISILIHGDASSNESFLFGESRDQRQNASNRQNETDLSRQSGLSESVNHGKDGSKSEKDLNLYA
jgi:flagellar hook-length control protein FliK